MPYPFGKPGLGICFLKDEKKCKQVMSEYVDSFLYDKQQNIWTI